MRLLRFSRRTLTTATLVIYLHAVLLQPRNIIMTTCAPRKEEVSLEVEAVPLEVSDDWNALYFLRRKRETLVLGIYGDSRSDATSQPAGLEHALFPQTDNCDLDLCSST